MERDRETQNGQGLFQGLFKNRYNDAIHDQSDGVMRCPSCHWEVEGYYCDRCELDFDDDSLADFSDYSYSSGLDLHGSEEADVSDEPNEDDEAFIDDGRDHEQHTSSRFLFNEDTVPPWLLPDDDIAEDMYDGPGTYSGPYQLESDSDEAIEHGIQRMNSLMAGSEHTISGSSGSGLSESEGSDSEDSSDANTSDGDNTDSSDEADEEPVQQHTRARPRAQATTNTRTESQRDNSRSRRSSVVDLTALDGPSTPQRRARRGTSTNDDNDSNQSATSTIRAGRRQNGTASSNEEEPETPIPIRPRKRERIVLSDSEDDDTSATVQTRPQARRRRINRNNSMAQYPDDQHHRQRMPLTESTPRDSSGTLSTLPSRRDEPPVRSVFPPLHRNAARSNRNILMPTTRASS